MARSYKDYEKRTERRLKNRKPEKALKSQDKAIKTYLRDQGFEDPGYLSKLLIQQTPAFKAVASAAMQPQGKPSARNTGMGMVGGLAGLMIDNKKLRKMFG